MIEPETSSRSGSCEHQQEMAEDERTFKIAGRSIGRMDFRSGIEYVCPSLGGEKMGQLSGRTQASMAALNTLYRAERRTITH